MNAELFRELSIIVGDEGMMKKAIKALRSITLPRVSKTKAVARDAESSAELPASFRRIRGMGHISQEEMEKDDRLAYILSEERRGKMYNLQCTMYNLMRDE